jgi:hypothetical protein
VNLPANPISKIQNPKWLIAAALLASSPALAQPEPSPETPNEATQRVLIDRTLAERPVRLVSITGDTIQVTDSAGRTVSLPRSQVLALIPPLTELDQPAIEERTINQQLPPSERAKVYGRLDLIDGQALPGGLAAASPSSDKPPDKPDQLSWNSKLFGRITLPLDSVKTLVLVPDRADLRPAAGTKDDTVILLNGDRAEGFVAGIGASIKLEKSGKTSDLPITRVAAVQLANAPRPPEGAWVWLYDGTAIAASQLTIDSAGHTSVAARLAGQSKQPIATLDANDLRAICFDAGSLRALAASPVTVVDAKPGTGPAQRRWTPPLKVPDAHGTPLGAVDIEIPGPMTVEWSLPPGATRLGTIAELPPSARVWGDCELIVESVNGSKTTPLAKVHLAGSTPSAEISVALNGATKLRMTIDPGPSGPIQDRVVLRRPVVLVEGKR